MAKSNHYDDRDLVKEVHSVRFDGYTKTGIEFVAQGEGLDYSKAVRLLCREALEARLGRVIPKTNVV